MVLHRTLSEVQRVLKPGGKFYYMEHIIAQEVFRGYPGDMDTLQHLMIVLPASFMSSVNYVSCFPLVASILFFQF